MLKQKGISTLEYSLLIVVVVAALVGMQIYFKRSLSGRWKASIDQLSFGRQALPPTSPPPPPPPPPPPQFDITAWGSCWQSAFEDCRLNGILLDVCRGAAAGNCTTQFGYFCCLPGWVICTPGVCQTVSNSAEYICNLQGGTYYPSTGECLY